MFQSLKKFKTLPDFVQVWPAHGAGSACGKSLGAVPNSTVGYEKSSNWALQYGDEDEQPFIDDLLSGQPEPPKYFAMMKHLNKVKRPLKIEIPQYMELSDEQFLSAFNRGFKVIDVRLKEDFADGFIPGVINIPNNNLFSTWMGWLTNYEEQFILLAAKDEIEDLTRKLMRIGMDNLYGYYSGMPLELGIDTSKIISIEKFEKLIGQPEIQIIDVRGASEYKAGHVKGAKNIFVGTLPDRLDEMDKNKETVIYCESGNRSTIAYSLLKKNGFEKVKNFSGGMQEWRKKRREESPQ